MRILAILTYYAPHWTGLTRHAQIAAEKLAQRGHEITVLCVRHSPTLLCKERLNGVSVVRAKPVCRFSRGMVAPSLLWRASQLIRNCDVVQIHTPLPEAPAIAALAKLHNRPLVMTHHGDVEMPPGIPNRLIQHSASHLLQTAGRLSAAVTSYSSDYARHSTLLHPLSHKLTCIAPPVEIPEPREEIVEQWRDELELHGRKVIGFAGRWVDEKGFDILLQAIPSVLARHPDAVFVYAGEPPVYEDFFGRCKSLIEEAGEHLRFAGLIHCRDRMAAFYRACNVVTLPSRSDMFALVQAEALLCGTPLVSSDIPGARVVVSQTKMGVLVKPNDPLMLAEGINHVLDCPHRYRPVRSRVEGYFHSDRAATAYENLFRSLVA